jgi:predicted PurR-regulated permease PerM
MHTPESSELIDRPADPGAPPQAPPIQVRNIAFILLSIAIVVLLLQFMQPVLLPLVLGALLFYALDPAVDRLQSCMCRALLARR